MKRNNKKGFTIVELVVVIAVIAILAAVLIPTFSGITTRAKETAAKADARAIATQYMSDHTDAVEQDTIYVDLDGNTTTKDDVYKVTNGVAEKYTIPSGKKAQAITCDADPDHTNCGKVVTIVNE
ncbi:MAG: type II secretion system protein [Clostridia bacterium]|nr:type II secretion system protein [Clostridia bacterium]